MTRLFHLGRWCLLVHFQADGGMVWSIGRDGIALRWLLVSLWRI